MKIEMNIIKKIAVLGVLLILSGCSKHYQVNSKFIQEDRGDLKAEIVETQEYTKSIKNIKSIAIAAPERCKSETVANATGTTTGAGGVNSGVLMKTECGIEMGEIEKALAKAGFQVISWQVIANAEKMAKISTKNITRQDIAKEHGADALLQINSLERTQNTNSVDARWDRKIFTNDKNGLVPTQVSPSDLYRIKNATSSYENSFYAMLKTRPSVTIDASFVNVNTGRTIWFYQRTKPQALSSKTMVLKQALNCSYNPVLQEIDGWCYGNLINSDEHPDVGKHRSGWSTAVSVQNNSDKTLKAQYYKLLRTVMDDMLIAFKK